MEKLKNISLVLFFFLMVIGFLLISQTFLVPFLFSLLIAMIIYPVCKKLEIKKFPRGLAILISVSIVCVFFGLIILLLILQLKSFNKDLPQLMEGFNEELVKAQNWIVGNLGVSMPEQKNIFIEARKNFSGNISGFISGATVGLFNLVIIPVYACLILYYRNVIMDFVVSVANIKYKEKVVGIMQEAIHIYFNYIKGMFFVYLVVGVLNSLGLFFLGVKHPLLFGMLTAFMTIIPYFGIIISSLLPISVAWMETKNFLVPFGIVAVFSFVQYLEAYFIFPYIIGKQLNINTFASIVVIIIGGLIWGVSGMVLFLPFVALLKIVLDKLQVMEPFRILLEIPVRKKKKTAPG